jgi:uncharacterized protein (TIGR03790 family)
MAKRTARAVLAAAGAALALLVVAPVASAQGLGSGHYDFGAAAASLSPPPRSPWLRIRRASGRITARDLGLVINVDDPASVEIGAYYIRARRLSPAQVLRVKLPVRASLTPEEFKAFAKAVDAAFGASVQALALAWTMPYAVNCNSITGALALGFDPALCAQTCAASRRSPYFDSATARPQTDLKLRPSMLLAAGDVAAAKAMIRRGVESDFSLGLRGAPPVNAYFVSTSDAARSVRTPLFPPAGSLPRVGVEVHVEHTQAIADVRRLLLYETGLARVDKLDTLRWMPGALADHLTSFGGVLDGSGGQMSALAWIASGATASYGTVSEPCAHPQKFPHPQLLLLNYLQGASAIEAYWKSVAWPQQGIFIGEPLAAPFARR